MRGFQDRLALLSQLRRVDIATMTEKMAAFFRDRELCRVVLEYYGRSLEGFESRGELLRAYHDALCGAWLLTCLTFGQCCSFMIISP